MMEADMERWRKHFRKAGADIWCVIQAAIHIAAVDYPSDFRRMRAEIAETLFARELLRSHSAHVEPETVFTFEEGNVRQGVRQMVEMQAEPDGVAYQDIDDLGRHSLKGAALMDEPEEEQLVLQEINIIKEACDDTDQPETTVFEALDKLKYMKITVKMLEVTEIAKKVKRLRKHPSVRVSTLAKELVSDWRHMALEWIDAAEEATITPTAGAEWGEFSKQEGLSIPPLDEDAVLEARASPVELSKLFSFINEDMCGGRFNESATPPSSVTPSVKRNPGSMLIGSIDFDDNAQKWGLRMAEERGSATRDRIELHERDTDFRERREVNGLANQDDDNGLMALNNAPKCSGPGRPDFDTPRVKSTSSTGKSPGNLTSISRSNLLCKNSAAHTQLSSMATMKLDKNLADQKLEIAKRKLYKGYAEAENAKKQRIVQVLDVSDLPKSGQVVRTRVNSSVQNRSGPRKGFVRQNGRYS